jgi:hypothetical protein
LSIIADELRKPVKSPNTLYGTLDKVVGHLEDRIKLYNDAKSELTHMTTYRCAPIKLPEALRANLDKVSRLTLAAQGMIIADVDVKAHPETIEDSLFYPFYSDKPIDLHDNDSKWNDVILTAYQDDINGTAHLIEIDDNPSCKENSYLLRHVDGSFTILRLREGCYGRCV